MFAAAIGITLVSLTDTIATSTSFAARRGDEVDPNQEMIGVGSANLAAGFFQGFAVSTSASRTAVAEQSGAKTQLTGLVGASLVVLLLVFFSSLVANLPQTALAAVVIAAALSLVDLRILRRYYEIRRTSFALSLAATAGVVFFGVLEGIALAVVLSILLFFRRSWWPHGEVLGRVDGQEGWHSVRAAPTAVEPPDLLVYRWEAPLFFANANMFRQQIRHLVRASETALGRAPVCGDDRYRRHRGRDARTTRRGAERDGRQSRVRRAAQPAPGSGLPLRPVRHARP